MRINEKYIFYEKFIQFNKEHTHIRIRVSKNFREDAKRRLWRKWTTLYPNTKIIETIWKGNE